MPAAPRSVWRIAKIDRAALSSVINNNGQIIRPEQGAVTDYCITQQS